MAKTLARSKYGESFLVKPSNKSVEELEEEITELVQKGNLVTYGTD